MFYKVGTLLNIKGVEGKVIGYIVYANPQDGNKTWTDYRIRSKKGECWLSCDEIYNEYSISWPANDVRGQIGPEWHKVDEGTQIVSQYGGDVDVDPGERASFVEYEDASEEHTLSVEIWGDGAEYSKGEYIEKSDITVMGCEKASTSSFGSRLLVLFVAAFFVFWIGGMLLGVFSEIIDSGSRIRKYLKGSTKYKYETSITGNEKQKADVYSYNKPQYTIQQLTTDDVAKDIIRGINGQTESVTQKDDVENEDIAIVTSKEYCLVYHPEGDNNTVYVQVSSRKYNYTSNNSPYRSSSVTTTWYRNHYYSSSYSKDSGSYRSSPSAYSMYNGTTIHNIGNGYFDTYASSIKQSSINSRKSSSGGTSSGK